MSEQVFTNISWTSPSLSLASIATGAAEGRSVWGGGGGGGGGRGGQSGTHKFYNKCHIIFNTVRYTELVAS